MSALDVLLFYHFRKSRKALILTQLNNPGRTAAWLAAKEEVKSSLHFVIMVF